MSRWFAAVKMAACAVALAGMVLVAGCGGGGGGGGNDPKSLAKQSYAVLVEMGKLDESGVKAGDAKYDAAKKKLDALTEKCQNLSKEEKSIYNDELKKIMNAAAGK
jgi:hypothetical protein